MLRCIRYESVYYATPVIFPMPHDGGCEIKIMVIVIIVIISINMYGCMCVFVHASMGVSVSDKISK